MDVGTASNWPDAANQILRDHWKTKSAREIAGILAGEGYTYSRNAVIGRGVRMGLKKDETIRVARAPRAPRPKVSVMTSHLMPSFAKAPPPPPFVPRIVEITPRRLTITELDDTTCKYECSGQPDAALFTFCGNPTIADRPYCAGHCHICYVAPISPRRRAA